MRGANHAAVPSALHGGRDLYPGSRPFDYRRGPGHVD